MNPRIIYFQLVGGAAGDMLLSVLHGLGVDFTNLQEAFEKKCPGFSLQFVSTTVSGLRGWQMKTTGLDESRWDLKDLNDWLAGVPLSEPGKANAREAINLLIEAESRAHGVPADQIHFHELGHLDTLVDIFGYFYGLEQLGIGQVYFSEVPAGKSFLQGVHGEMPNPPPVVVALMQGLRVEWRHTNAELVTPTAMALLKTSGTQSSPSLLVEDSSVAFGQRASLTESCLRAFLGTHDPDAEHLVLIETNLDDITPEQCAFAIDELLRAGARDAVVIPGLMKKGRPGWILQAWVPPESVDAVTEMLIQQTGTLGFRYQSIARIALPRKQIEVDTRFGKIRVKIAFRGNRTIHLKPEYEDCAAAARKFGVPLSEVTSAARNAARKRIYEN